jgi:predicted transport protein
MRTLDDLFSGRTASRQIFDSLRVALAGIDEAELRVTKSQIAFRRNKAFACVWVPGMYLHGDTAPLVLTVALRRRDSSPRWKEVVEIVKRRYTHHLELRGMNDIDDQILDRLQEAWADAS